jgi:hypothetical protein
VRPDDRYQVRPHLVGQLREIAKRFRREARRLRGDERDHARRAAVELTTWADEVAAQERAERLAPAARRGNPSRLGA